MWGTDFRICIQFFQLFFVEIIQLAGHVTGKRSFPRRAFSRGSSFMPFAKALPPGTFSFACQKRTRKAPATFEAREARTRGCSPLVTPKQKGSIQKIQVAPLEDFLCCADFESLRDGGTPTAADAASRYDLSRENAMPGGPQTARHCSIINNSSADATATTAACGRSREELLGPWPAGCKARSRAVAAAGCHNSSKAKRRAF